MMSGRVNFRFSSIAVNLFFWFWIVAIVSVFSSHIIIRQLGNKRLSLPVHHHDIRQLNYIEQYTVSNPVNSVHYFFQQLRHYKLLRNKNIWLKSLDNSEIYSYKGRMNNQLRNYLRENNLVIPVTIQFSQFRLTGPSVVNIDKHRYKLYISTKLKHKRPIWSVQRIPLWLSVTIMVVISFLLLWLLAKSLSRPLLKIQQAANELGNGNLNTRVQHIEQRRDELGELAKSFNKMAEKLENSVFSQQRLLGDVSHELRSPMTRLQLAIALAHKATHTPDALEKYLLRCETEIDRLDEMLADVITLSRLENTLQTHSTLPVNIKRLMTDLIADAQFIADEKSITIVFAPEKEETIIGNEQLLASAISNILTNAVKYSPKKTEIIVEFLSLPDSLIIEISDCGEGVPETTLDSLFKPFYRVQNDRSRTTGGTGLGLAIAKQAVLAHQGNITAHNNNVGGLTIVIKLPNNNVS